MSSRRKHLVSMLDVQPLSEGQQIARALGSRGSNLVEVETADQRQLLCLLPARFHKKLWIRRGSFVIIREGDAAEGEAKVTATIEAILQAVCVLTLMADYICGAILCWSRAANSQFPRCSQAADEKSMRKLPSVWPVAFTAVPAPQESLPADAVHPSDDSSDDDLPPPNTNRHAPPVYASDSSID